MRYPLVSILLIIAAMQYSYSYLSVKRFTSASIIEIHHSVFLSKNEGYNYGQIGILFGNQPYHNITAFVDLDDPYTTIYEDDLAPLKCSPEGLGDGNLTTFSCLADENKPTSNCSSLNRKNLVGF